MTRHEAYELARKVDPQVSEHEVERPTLYQMDPDTRARVANAHVFQVEHAGPWIGADEFVGVTDSDGTVFRFTIGE